MGKQPGKLKAQFFPRPILSPLSVEKSGTQNPQGLEREHRDVPLQLPLHPKVKDTALRRSSRRGQQHVRWHSRVTGELCQTQVQVVIDPILSLLPTRIFDGRSQTGKEDLTDELLLERLGTFEVDNELRELLMTLPCRSADENTNFIIVVVAEKLTRQLLTDQSRGPHHTGDEWWGGRPLMGLLEISLGLLRISTAAQANLLGVSFLASF